MRQFLAIFVVLAFSVVNGVVPVSAGVGMADGPALNDVMAWDAAGLAEPDGGPARDGALVNGCNGETAKAAPGRRCDRDCGPGMPVVADNRWLGQSPVLSLVERGFASRQTGRHFRPPITVT